MSKPTNVLERLYHGVPELYSKARHGREAVCWAGRGWTLYIRGMNPNEDGTPGGKLEVRTGLNEAREWVATGKLPGKKAPPRKPKVRIKRETYVAMEKAMSDSVLKGWNTAHETATHAGVTVAEHIRQTIHEHVTDALKKFVDIDFG